MARYLTNWIMNQISSTSTQVAQRACTATYRVNAVKKARLPWSIFVWPDQCFLFHRKFDTKLTFLGIHTFLSTADQLFLLIFLPTHTKFSFHHITRQDTAILTPIFQINLCQPCFLPWLVPEQRIQGYVAHIAFLDQFPYSTNSRLKAVKETERKLTCSWPVTRIWWRANSSRFMSSAASKTIVSGGNSDARMNCGL